MAMLGEGFLDCFCVDGTCTACVWLQEYKKDHPELYQSYQPDPNQKCHHNRPCRSCRECWLEERKRNRKKK